jgi:cholesterol oxidase
MTETFDAVVVGSGFGGSVMAYRLAATGSKVCLLERGKAYPPGSFSRTPLEVRNNFWDPSEQRYGLFNVWSFRGMSAIVSAGLGGGSLIYANVFIRKDKAWFADPLLGAAGSWPITRAQLDPHYDAVEAVVKPEIYPSEYQNDNKTSAMRRAAQQLGFAVTKGDGDARAPQWYLPHLAVTFREAVGAPARPGRVFDNACDNYHRMPRETCRLCGECDVGCNYGSKNTMDYTYITLAQKHGAEIRPLCEVKEFWPQPEGGYRVAYVAHDPSVRTTPGRAVPGSSREIVTRRLILCAGTLGSTYLLLKMRQAGVLGNISPRLGSRFSGNGDLLMFVRRCHDEQRQPVRLNASRAPVITSTFRFPDGVDDGSPHRGFYLQDAGYPLALDYVWELLDKGLIARIGRAAWNFIEVKLTGNLRAEIDRQLGTAVGEGRLSSTSMPLLGMGRDVPNGIMSTVMDPKTGVPLLALRWDDGPSKSYMREAFAKARAVAVALGGRYTVNPLTRIFNSLVTVHPLGGCPMAETIDDGVVDPRGEVFNYPGLHVADGSVLPGPVGANPSFTIAAVSNLIADSIIGASDYK